MYQASVLLACFKGINQRRSLIVYTATTPRTEIPQQSSSVADHNFPNEIPLIGRFASAHLFSVSDPVGGGNMPFVFHSSLGFSMTQYSQSQPLPSNTLPRILSAAFRNWRFAMSDVKSLATWYIWIAAYFELLVSVVDWSSPPM